MTDNERDTHFQGFAELLYQELSTLEGSHETVLSEYRNKYDKQAIVQLIAQRAFDLVRYAYHFVDSIDEPLTWDEILAILPDFTQWLADTRQDVE